MRDNHERKRSALADRNRAPNQTRTFNAKNSTLDQKKLEAALKRGAGLRLGTWGELYTLSDLRERAAINLPEADLSIAQIVAAAYAIHFLDFGRPRASFNRWLFLGQFQIWIARCFEWPDFPLEIVAAALRALGYTVRKNNPPFLFTAVANIRSCALIPWELAPPEVDLGDLPQRFRFLRIAWHSLRAVLPPIEIVEPPDCGRR
jgi:hypothetical protein